MRRASRSQGMAGLLLPRRAGNTARSASVTVGCSCGSLRKNQAQARIQKRLATPRTTKEPRQVTTASKPAINGGVTAIPIRENECVIPCAKPQLPTGVQLDIARVAVGNAAPSPNPKATLSANNDTNPAAAPVSMVETATIPQQADSVSRGP